MIDLFGAVELVAYDGNQYVIHFPFNRETKDKLKRVPGAKWSSLDKRWTAPATTQATLALKNCGLPWTDEAKFAISLIENREIARAEASKAATADLDLPHFGLEPYPFQKAGIKYALEAKRVIIGDEMGLGKTIQGLGTVYGASAYPCLVVTPASLKYNWGETEAPRAMPMRRVTIADKETGPLLLQMSDVIVTNYEQLVGFRTIEGTKTRTSWEDPTKTKVVLSPLAQYLKEIGLKSIILDEAHYIKDGGSARTHAVMELREGTEYRLCLTGTPVLNRPAELASMLKFLDRLDEFGGWWHFMTHYCGLKKGRFGMEAKESPNSLELNGRLRASCYVRRKKKEVLPELPGKTRRSFQVDIDNRKEYLQAELQLIEWVRQRVLKDKVFLESIQHLGETERHYQIRLRQEDKAERAERAEEMVRFNALKQITARGKLKAAKEWIGDFLDTEEKLLVFATHKEILQDLLKQYPKAARILAEDDPRERQRNVQRFQTSDNTNLIILAMGTSATNSPGGVGHTLTAASNVLFLELGWNPALHDQCEDRCDRIGQKNSVIAHYILGRNTIDIDIADLIESKRSMTTQVVDGDEAVTETRIIDELKVRLASR